MEIKVKQADGTVVTQTIEGELAYKEMGIMSNSEVGAFKLKQF